MAKLYFRYGAMDCGKTTSILQVAHNYEEVGFKVLVLKSAHDTKGDANIVSRLNVEREVDYLFEENDNMKDILRNYLNINCILVDEAEFLMPKQVDELWEITKENGIPVICYGLRCDFQLNAFPGSPRLLLLADDIEEIKTICKCGCGKKATQNMRLKNGVPVFEGEQRVIDDEKARENNIEYKSVCGDCYLKERKRILYKKH